jgi:glyoxylase-like metal-dependent hydrolase (beta-lactamase superfamily II)
MSRSSVFKNTRRQGEAGVPTFHNARYLFSEDELEFAQSEAFRPCHVVGVEEDSIEPILHAGEVLKGFRHLPTPGHTPGHMSIELSSAGERAIFTSGMLHNPLQVWLPH